MAAAEDQTRIFTEQTLLLAGIRNDVATMKTIMEVWSFLSLLGLIGYVIVVNTSRY